MERLRNCTVLPAVAPTTWPEPPRAMSVSTLAEMELCPRRWALKSAAYPEIWSGKGYPPKTHLNALGGSVVHLTVEAVTRALALEGCPSVEDPVATRVVRDLGGFTQVVNDSIDRVLER